MAQAKCNYTFRDIQDAVENATAGYRKSINNQAKRIGAFVLFLNRKGLLDEFNSWEENLKKEQNGAAGSGNTASDSDDQRA